MDEKTKKGAYQINVSKAFINSLVRGTSESIFGLKLKNERIQKNSKQQEEQRRLERYNQIQTEAISANKKNAAI